MQLLLLVLNLDPSKSNNSHISIDLINRYVEFVKLYNPLSEKVNQCADEIQLTDDMYTLLDENGVI